MYLKGPSLFIQSLSQSFTANQEHLGLQYQYQPSHNGRISINNQDILMGTKVIFELLGIVNILNQYQMAAISAAIWWGKIGYSLFHGGALGKCQYGPGVTCLVPIAR